MTTTQEFIASYWTLAGNVVPLGPPDQEASPHDFRERVEVAARLGYCGVGLMHSDLVQIRRQYDLDDKGLEVLKEELIDIWELAVDQGGKMLV